MPCPHHSGQVSPLYLLPCPPAGRAGSWRCYVGRPADASSKGVLYIITLTRPPQASPCPVPHCGGQVPGKRSRSPKFPSSSGQACLGITNCLVLVIKGVGLPPETTSETYSEAPFETSPAPLVHMTKLTPTKVRCKVMTQWHLVCTDNPGSGMPRGGGEDVGHGPGVLGCCKGCRHLLPRARLWRHPHCSFY